MRDADKSLQEYMNYDAQYFNKQSIISGLLKTAAMFGTQYLANTYIGGPLMAAAY